MWRVDFVVVFGRLPTYIGVVWRAYHKNEERQQFYRVDDDDGGCLCLVQGFLDSF